jgi:hypothetical protein
MIHPPEFINNAATVVGYLTMFIASVTGAVVGLIALFKKLREMVLEAKRLKQAIDEPLPQKSPKQTNWQPNKTAQASQGKVVPATGGPLPVRKSNLNCSPDEQTIQSSDFNRFALPADC